MNKIKCQVTCILRFYQPCQSIVNLAKRATRQRHTCRTTGRWAWKSEMRNPRALGSNILQCQLLGLLWLRNQRRFFKSIGTQLWLPVVEKILNFINLLLGLQGHRGPLHLKLLCCASGFGDRDFLPCVVAFSFPGFKFQFWDWKKTCCSKKTEKKQRRTFLNTKHCD